MSKEYYQQNDAIEGEKVELFARKVQSKAPMKDEHIGKIVIAYDLTRNSSAEITKAVTLTDEDKEICKKVCGEKGLSLHCDVGDKLRGDSITVYIQGIKKLKQNVSEGHSHTHGGTTMTSDRRTFGIISYPFKNFRDKYNALPQKGVKQIKDKQ